MEKEPEELAVDKIMGILVKNSLYGDVTDGTLNVDIERFKQDLLEEFNKILTEL